MHAPGVRHSVPEPLPLARAVENPARVVPSQRKYIQVLPGQRFQPIRPAPVGFVVLKDSRPEAGEVEYLFVEKPAPAAQPAGDVAAAAGGAAPAQPQQQLLEEEPPPPAPFEYVPS